MELVGMERVDLKKYPEVNEALIQKFLYEHPEILKLGDIDSIRKEKIQPTGGRLDLLLGDENTRYEVEIQLGATDPSHIIRTIEYWDTEKKRYPQYNHYAVIIAEEITGRFMNVISLLNGAVPLIAFQLCAYKKEDGNIQLDFVKILDRITMGEEDEGDEVTDRAYWEKKSTSKLLKTVDDIFEDIKEYVSGYELKYNKFYIGVAKNGVAKNFISFKPKKTFLYICTKGEDIFEQENNMDITYDARWKQYQIKINNYDEYKTHKEIITKYISASKEYYNIEE